MLGTHQLRLLQLLGEVDKVGLLVCCACLFVGQMRPCHPAVTGGASCMHHADMLVNSDNKGLGVCSSPAQSYASLDSGRLAACPIAY